MDGADFDDTVIRPRDDRDRIGGAPDSDPSGLVEDTVRWQSAAGARADERAHDPSHSAHAQVTAPTTVPRVVPRYRFRVNDGEALTTDARTFIGRSPRPPRIPGQGVARLVRVDSAGQEVSGTHLELRQEGGSVVVVDLRSTNGTVVTMPGAAPLRMLPGESMVAVPGSLIDIGDGNVVEILGVERQVPSDVRERLIL